MSMNPRKLMGYDGSGAPAEFDRIFLNTPQAKVAMLNADRSARPAHGTHTLEVSTMGRFTPALAALTLLLVASSGFSASKAARAPLGRTIPDLRLTGVPLSDAVDALRDSSGANIHVNWRALEEQGVGKDTTVNLRVRGVTLEKALMLVLSEAGAGDRLTYYTDDGVIEITTRELADSKLITRVYPVDDLIVDVPDFQGPQFDLSSNNSGSSGGK